MSISIGDAVKRVAPDLLAIALLRESRKNLKLRDEQLRVSKEKERELAIQVVDVLLEVEWRKSPNHIFDLIDRLRKKSGE